MSNGGAVKIDDLALWETFVMVAKRKNFTVAARELGVGIPLVSKRISRMEETLKIRLFERSTHGVRLSAEGLALYPRAEAALADMAQLESVFHAKAELEGLIRITTIATIGARLLPAILSDFSKMHEGIRFHIETSAPLKDLIQENFDLAIRVAASPKDGSFIYKKIMRNELVLCASPAYFKEHSHRLRKPDDLKGAKLIIEPHFNPVFSLSKKGILEYSSNPFVQTDDAGLLTQLVLDGHGIAVRSLWDAKPFFDSGRLVRVLEDAPIDPWNYVYVVLPSKKFISARVKAFFDFLCPRLMKAGK